MASSPQHEPTMEEILASIRKIISEDSPAAESPVAEVPAPPAPPAPQLAPAAEIEVLELTQEVMDSPAQEFEPAPAPVDDIVFQEAAPAPAPNNDIFSDATRKALDDAFDDLDEIPEPEPAPRLYDAMPSTSGANIEAVFERAVRDSFEPVLRSYLSDHTPAIIEGMKPLIREWMDEHFPPMLENAVRAEVERVVKSRKR